MLKVNEYFNGTVKSIALQTATPCLPPWASWPKVNTNLALIAKKL